MASLDKTITENISSASGITPSDADCDMCSKIMDMFQFPLDGESQIEEVKLGKVRDLLAYNCPHANWLRHIKYMHGPVPFYEKRDLSLYKWKRMRELSLGLGYTTKFTSSVFSTTADFGLVTRPEIHHHHGKVRILDNHWVNLDVIKDWPARCIRMHGSICDKTAGNVRPFKPQLLVDVVQACVVVCKEDSPRFITLSYTWGQIKNFRTTKSNIQQLRKPGALRSDNIISQLPKTIIDAIELTKALGETWLWVDSLCIIQDDEEGLARELAQMHRIYATSFLTIIAADGWNADYGLRGLRGISSERSINQIILPLSGGERIAWIEPDPSDREASELSYSQRMWTSQEHDFSKRRLSFKSGKVQWECNCTKWTEDHVYDNEVDKLRRMALNGYIGSGIPSRVPSLSTLNNLLRNFNSRTLRFEEDVFDAFSGYSTYLNSIFPSGLVYGHPEFFFDISLCWYSVDGLRRRTVSKHYKGDPAHNRLPSWSWMGWHGRTSFPYDSEAETHALDLGFTEAITEWYAMEHPGSTERRPIKSTWSQCRKAPPESILDGWRSIEYKPPVIFDRYDTSTLPQYMPKDLPSCIYTYILDGDDDPTSRWYPIPVNKHSPETGSVPGLHSGYQYIWCQTTRAYLLASPDSISLYGSRQYIHLLKDINGATIGFLDLPNEDNDRLSQKETKVELIAVAKGWTSILSRDTAESESYKLSEDQHLTEQEEQEKRQEWIDSWSNEEPLWKDEWERAREDKQDGYHALWIEWENDVAYRRAYGFVLAEEWERLAEPGKADILLG
ncbi:HET-domain-containing protein [Fusarium austroafricanum]|uniref:HET-domain-containing protein n=1 Tax=Fusarium austroafricanum TaxID=2364996 RepID=A0A8H4KX46_9HYPO|nr:HET-domain-containing protein [Fusarium austroafricanum]